MIVKGILFGHCETGTEGTSWAIQDEKYISQDGKNWNYAGLHIVKSGHYLIICDKDGIAVWGGRVNLKYDSMRHTLYGMHNVPTNCNIHDWCKWFYGESKGEPYYGILVK